MVPGDWPIKPVEKGQSFCFEACTLDKCLMKANATAPMTGRGGGGGHPLMWIGVLLGEASGSHSPFRVTHD